MFFKFICAVVTRSLFILVSLIGVWRVVYVKENGLYWFLTILFLPLIAEMIVTLKRSRGNGYRWFSPAIFLFLISIIPSLWILELHHKQNDPVSSGCKHLSSAENIQSVLTPLMNTTDSRALMSVLSSVCPNDWILALHQTLIVLLILGKWLLPIAGEMSRDQLSQLLLIFVGTAADILEFTSETLSDIRSDSAGMVYVILAVWTWSMLQFPLHFSVMDECEEDLSSARSLFTRLRAEIWSTVEALLIQDGPFLLVRITVMFYFSVAHQMLIFFTIKNLLVVILNIYRLYVLICDKTS